MSEGAILHIWPALTNGSKKNPLLSLNTVFSQPPSLLLAIGFNCFLLYLTDVLIHTVAF
jgi:hypothetical protein